MHRWVALLRGVNVGGVKVLNADLVMTLQSLGFSQVKPVQAAGSVAFDAAESDESEVRGHVEEALRARFSRPVPTLLFSQAKVVRIAESYPFERDDAVTHPYVTFATSQSDVGILMDAVTAAGCSQDAAAGERVLYWRCPKGETLTSPVSQAMGKARTVGTVTNRNLRTVEKLATS